MPAPLPVEPMARESGGTTRRPERRTAAPRHAVLRVAAGVVALVAAATTVRLLLNAWLGHASPLLPYAFAISLVAAWWGLWPTVAATALSMAAAAWLFLEPLRNFAVASPAHRLSLVIFGALGVSLGLLGERGRRSHRLERQRSRALRQAIEEFESLMRLAPVGILVARDAHGASIEANPHAARLLGLQPGVDPGGAAAGTGTGPGPALRDDARIAARDLPLQRVARTGEPVFDALHELPSTDGEWRSILVSAVPLHDAAGRARGAIGTMQDVTALRAMQSQLAARTAQLHTLFEAMSEGYGIVERLPAHAAGTGHDWRLEEANPAFERLTGLGSALGRALPEAAPGGEHPWLECCAQAAERGASVTTELCDPTRQHRWFKVDAHPLGVATGMRVAVFMREVTERRRAEQDAGFLLFLADQMRRRAEDPDALVTTVLHSLRTHLDLDRVRLTEVDVDAVCSRVVREIARPGLAGAASGQSIAGLDTTLLRQLASGLAWTVEDVDREPAARAMVRPGSGTRAFVAAPLLRGGRWVASLAVAATQPRRWTAREVRLVETIAERLWAALEIARAGASLRESEQRFRLMADGLPLLVWMHDARGALHFVNREYSRFFGVTLDEVVGSGWKPLLHPADGPGYVGEFERCLRERRSFHASVRVRDAAGRWRWIESHGEPRFLPDGTLLGMVGASSDITERRQSDQDRDFLFALGEALQRCRSRVAIADAAAQRLGGYLGVDRCGLLELPAEGGTPMVLREYLPARVPSLVGPRPMRHGHLVFERELHAGATVVVPDVRVDARVAEHAALLCQLDIRALIVVPLRRGERLAATLGLWQAEPREWSVREVDLVRGVAERLWPALESAQAMEATAALAADRERLLDAERAARGEVETANRLKDEFLATISHELRTPLANIISWTYVVQQSLGRDADAVRRGLSIIAGNARAQSNLISDLLDMSRIVEGKLRLECVPIALCGFVAECVESHAPAAAEAGLALDHECSVGPEARVDGDPRRLRQVLGNLLTNALKFTPPGGRVLVEVGPVDAGYEIAVRDSGEGIEPSLLPHLFERFRQGDSSASRQHGGLGIGLSLVRQLVELHGGRVSAHSEGRGQGATFRVWLPGRLAGPDSEGGDSPPGATAGDSPWPGPRVTAPSGASPAATESVTPPWSATGPTAGEDDCRGLRILVVEDEASMREFMQRTLEERGASVHAVASATEVLQLLQDRGAGRFDVLVSDIGLPELDGYRLIRRIREELHIGAERLPAIAVTAFSRDEDRARSLDAGFQAHLPKPYSVVQLVRLIAQQVRRGGTAPR